MFEVTKTYGHDLGLSACFRQWRAKSHCRFLHGYPLSFKFTFAASTLDENNWVIDFGGLKPVKSWLANTFDHKLLVAEDDPARWALELLNSGQLMDEDENVLEADRLADVVVVPYVGCEGFANLAYDHVNNWLRDNDYSPRVWLVSVEVREHGGNSAIYYGSPA